MPDRPTALDLALDAIDDAFKQAVVQYTKNCATGEKGDVLLSGISRVSIARGDMIRFVTKVLK